MVDLEGPLLSSTIAAMKASVKTARAKWPLIRDKAIEMVELNAVHEMCPVDPITFKTRQTSAAADPSPTWYAVHHLKSEQVGLRHTESDLKQCAVWEPIYVTDLKRRAAVWCWLTALRQVVLLDAA
jgi:hypothetical protein